MAKDSTHGQNGLGTFAGVFTPSILTILGIILFLRLGYVGLEIPDLIAAFGKNWSTYYQIAGFTDRFESTGGSASGAFNAQTDGGNTGTGHADRTLQARMLIDYFPDNRWLKLRIPHQS